MVTYIIIFIFIIIFIYICKTRHRICIKYNGDTFVVNKSTKQDQRKKVEILWNLKNKLRTLVEHMYNNKEPNEESSKRLYDRFKTLQLNEMDKKENSVAYTLNKDDEIRICLTKYSDSSNGEFYDEDVIMFILLHELAHVMSVNYGHGQEFIDNMDFLVKKAVVLKIYTPRDFNKTPAEYCGTTITSSPCNGDNCPLN